MHGDEHLLFLQLPVEVPVDFPVFLSPEHTPSQALGKAFPGTIWEKSSCPVGFPGRASCQPVKDVVYLSGFYARRRAAAGRPLAKGEVPMREAEKVRVLLIIPAYNEEANIQRVIGRVREYRKTCPYQLDYVVINDGSTDSTARICRENGIHHISLLQNLGIGGAVQTGYLYAQREGYDIAVQFDGDGQHDLNSLPQLLVPVVRGDCDFCVGSRFLDKSSAFQSTPLRRVGIQYLSWLIRLFTGTKVTDPTSGFRAANQAVIRDLADYYPADYPEPESIVQIKKMRHRIQEVQVNMFQREGGQSSIRSWKSIYYMIKVSVAVVCASLQKGRKKK